MKGQKFDRRKFIQKSAATASGLMLIPSLADASFAVPGKHSGSTLTEAHLKPIANPIAPRIKFSVIGINHGHIYSQTEAVIRGGGEFVSFYAKEPDLSAAFSKKFPQAKQVKSEKEILEDKSIHLILSAIIPDQRAPLGIRVMQHGKDYMADKPGITTLKQLEEARRVQKETGRIYSIMYSERLENRAT
ncbi:MAG: Gfo/Idh/MocA family oxidoreductase, partial [Bacteroidota bacterium]|nr:Gfo/Idh/MocA family oxidoreductase [Bacteroidota bacterium]